MRMPPARAVPLTGADQAVFAAPALFRGYSLRETAGLASATIQFFDNTAAASGTLLATITLPSGASVDILNDGVWAARGVFAHVSGTGVVEGSARLG